MCVLPHFHVQWIEIMQNMHSYACYLHPFFWMSSQHTNPLFDTHDEIEEKNEGEERREGKWKNIGCLIGWNSNEILKKKIDGTHR